MPIEVSARETKRVLFKMILEMSDDEARDLLPVVLNKVPRTIIVTDIQKPKVGNIPQE